MSVKDDWKSILLVAVGLGIAIHMGHCVSSGFTEDHVYGVYEECLKVTREPAKCRELLP